MSDASFHPEPSTAGGEGQDTAGPAARPAEAGNAEHTDNELSDELGELRGLDELLGEQARKVAAERDEYLDSLRRLQADFDNFRKRALRQQTELLERASEALVRQLLPVLDALDLAIDHASSRADDDTGDNKADAEALVQIGALLRDTIAREGVERIDALEVPFDPTVHDAVAHEPPSEDDPQAAEARTPVVTEVLRAGYCLKGRVIRPAMVKVRG